MISRQHQAGGFLVFLVIVSAGGSYLAGHEIARGGPSYSLLEFIVIGCGIGLWAIGFYGLATDSRRLFRVARGQEQDPNREALADGGSQ